MQISLSLILGYLLGTLSPSYLMSRLRGFDVRDRGSGNAGASNTLLTMGARAGAVCALLDILKCFLAYRLARKLCPALQVAGILAGCACVLGHIYPIWMQFRGGKGLACMAGMVLAHDWRLFLLYLIIEAALVLALDYICLMAITVALSLPVLYLLRYGPDVAALALLVVAFVVCRKHRENLRRIMAGQEVRVSYLWNREEEIARLEKNSGP